MSNSPNTPRTPHSSHSSHSPVNVHKEIDTQASIAKYIERIRTIPPQELSIFNNKWITTYNIFSTILARTHSSISVFIYNNLYEYHLLTYLLSLNISVNGITSERKKGGQFICRERANASNDDCVYIGKYSYFAQSSLAKATSQFALHSCDIVHKSQLSSESTFVFQMG